MTDYIPFTATDYAPDAPATALSFEAWYRNWIAGFEGASGAPKLQPKARASSLIGAQSVTGASSWCVFTGLGDVDEVYLDLAGAYNASGTAAAIYQIAFTADGGATWGTSQTLLSSGAGGSSEKAMPARANLSLVTGALTAISWTGVNTGAVISVASLTVPAACNGFRVRNPNAATGWATACMAHIMSGR